jgi:hypothetical protein
VAVGPSPGVVAPAEAGQVLDVLGQHLLEDGHPGRHRERQQALPNDPRPPPAWPGRAGPPATPSSPAPRPQSALRYLLHGDPPRGVWGDTPTLPQRRDQGRIATSTSTASGQRHAWHVSFRRVACGHGTSWVTSFFSSDGRLAAPSVERSSRQWPPTPRRAAARGFERSAGQPAWRSSARTCSATTKGTWLSSAGLPAPRSRHDSATPSRRSQCAATGALPRRPGRRAGRAGRPARARASAAWKTASAPNSL